MQKSLLMFRESISATTQAISCCLLLVTVMISCDRERTADDCCTFSELPHRAPNPEQGILLVQGSTPATYYVLNDSGERLHSQALNKSVALGEGTYTLRVNNSVHTVEIRAGEEAKCSTGTLIISGNNTDYYQVMDSNKVQLAHEVLSKATSLFPGNYTVQVNGTEVNATVRVREMTEIRCGGLLASGATGEIYYVLDRDNKQLSHTALGTSLSLLPGAYEVKVNNTSRKANVVPGKVTELTTGMLIVSGLTDEYYYVTDTLGQALNYQTLNKPLAFFPGEYQVKVNNTTIVARVTADKLAEFPTGSLMLTGGGSGYYYVFDQLGNQLNYNSLNRSLSFFPSEYIVKLGTSTRQATVIPGELTSINAQQ